MSIQNLLQVIEQSRLPLKSDVFVLSEFVDICQIEEKRVQELVALEFIAPSRINTDLLFTKSDLYKVLKLQRICKDFEVNDLAASIIIDLVERIEILEQQIKS